MSPPHHSNLPVHHLPSSTSFYLSILYPLGYTYLCTRPTPGSNKPPQVVLATATGIEFSLVIEESPANKTGRSTLGRVPRLLSFSASSTVAVREFYTAAIKSGGKSLRGPRWRTRRGVGGEELDEEGDESAVFDAEIGDLEGNLVEAVFRNDDGSMSEEKDCAGRCGGVSEWRGCHREVEGAGCCCCCFGLTSPSRVGSSTGNADASMEREVVSTEQAAVLNTTSTITTNGLIGTILGAVASAAVVYAMVECKRDSARDETTFSDSIKRASTTGSLAEAEAPDDVVYIPASLVHKTPSVVSGLSRITPAPVTDKMRDGSDSGGRGSASLHSEVRALRRESPGAEARDKSLSSAAPSKTSKESHGKQHPRSSRAGSSKQASRSGLASSSSAPSRHLSSTSATTKSISNGDASPGSHGRTRRHGGHHSPHDGDDSSPVRVESRSSPSPIHRSTQSKTTPSVSTSPSKTTSLSSLTQAVNLPLPSSSTTPSLVSTTRHSRPVSKPASLFSAAEVSLPLSGKTSRSSTADPVFSPSRRVGTSVTSETRLERSSQYHARVASDEDVETVVPDDSISCVAWRAAGLREESRSPEMRVRGDFNRGADRRGCSVVELGEERKGFSEVGKGRRRRRRRRVGGSEQGRGSGEGRTDEKERKDSVVSLPVGLLKRAHGSGTGSGSRGSREEGNGKLRSMSAVMGLSLR